MKRREIDRSNVGGSIAVKGWRNGERESKVGNQFPYMYICIYCHHSYKLLIWDHYYRLRVILSLIWDPYNDYSITYLGSL